MKTDTNSVVKALFELATTRDVTKAKELLELRHPIERLFVTFTNTGNTFNPLLMAMCLAGIPSEMDDSLFWLECKKICEEKDDEKKAHLLLKLFKLKAAPMFFLSGLCGMHPLTQEQMDDLHSTLVVQGYFYALRNNLVATPTKPVELPVVTIERPTFDPSKN